MKICIYHKRMGVALAAAVKSAFPDIQVDVVHDVEADPAGRDEIDVLLANTFPRGLLHRCQRLRWLHLTGTGIDHVIAESPPPHLLVTHSASVPARAVAEFAWMGILALAKGAPLLVQQQAARAWQPPSARMVAGTHLLLVGLGRIGTEIARRAAGFDMRLTAVARSARASALVDRVIPPEGLREAARDAEHLVIAVPATPATRHLIDAQVIRALPPHAVVINVGRPSVLDVDALVEALAKQRLRGALLDVHHQEPLPPESPLWDVENLWITPHCAYQYPGEEADIATLFVDNVRRFRADIPLRNLALPETIHAR